MDIDEQQRLRTDADFNYYIISAFRPGAQIFAVRAEWEIVTPDPVDEDEAEEIDTSEDESEDFHIAIIQFGGLPHLVISVPRTTHSQIKTLANDLRLNVVPGHPMTSDKEHFPLEAAADSIYTLESFPNTVTKQNLQQLRRRESQEVMKYLQARSEEEDNQDCDPGEEDCVEVILENIE